VPLSSTKLKREPISESLFALALAFAHDCGGRSGRLKRIESIESHAVSCSDFAHFVEDKWLSVSAWSGDFAEEILESGAHDANQKCAAIGALAGVIVWHMARAKNEIAFVDEVSFLADMKKKSSTFDEEPFIFARVDVGRRTRTVLEFGAGRESAPPVFPASRS
jgi:hypothetical protein